MPRLRNVNPQPQPMRYPPGRTRTAGRSTARLSHSPRLRSSLAADFQVRPGQAPTAARRLVPRLAAAGAPGLGPYRRPHRPEIPGRNQRPREPLGSVPRMQLGQGQQLRPENFPPKYFAKIFRPRNGRQAGNCGNRTRQPRPTHAQSGTRLQDVTCCSRIPGGGNLQSDRRLDPAARGERTAG